MSTARTPAKSALRSAMRYSHQAGNYRRFLSDLQALVRIPSISAQPRYVTDVNRCANWLARHLQQIGLEHVEIVPTAKHPFVYADWLHVPDCPTLLIYGHYDVQPVDPLSAWKTPPFEPVIRGDHLYGRGASDDKGQLFVHLKALESFLRTSGRLPINVKCILEGEEEIGSPGLRNFIRHNGTKLAADFAVMSDTTIPDPKSPAVTYALRGSLRFVLTVVGPVTDLHSGKFGGAVHNPIQALSEIICKLHDTDGRIVIPGFYDSVREWSARERAYMAQVGPTATQFLQEAGDVQPWGEPDYSVYERVTIRPALTINGITGGYQGPGHKAVIPAYASAKLSLRLVPDQDPVAVARLVQQYIQQIAPPTVQVRMRFGGYARPVVLDRRTPIMKAAKLAYQAGFSAQPVFLRSGGTIPVVNTLQESLGIPTVLMGFGLPDDRIHAPNERFHLPTFRNGITTIIWLLNAIGHLESSVQHQRSRMT